jgi:FtsZ-interacting cell division protein YlmF
MAVIMFPRNKAKTVQCDCYEDAADIVDRLKTGESFFVDYSNCSQVQRAIDFIHGAIFAIDGGHRRYGDLVYFYMGAMPSAKAV